MRKATSLLLALPFLLAGCGGGGSSHSSGGTTAPEAKGAATVSIDWPARIGKFVPLASNGVVVALSQNGARVGQQILARPTDGVTRSTATFTGLSSGTYTADLAAYPNVDGSGIAQARGTASLTVADDAPGVASASMTTTVASLSILPVTFDKHGAATATVGAKDASGATVLLAVGDASETVSWSADKVPNSLGAMVDALTLSAVTGTSVTLTGVHSGTTQIHAHLPELGLTATGAVTVNAIADGTGMVTIS